MTNTDTLTLRFKGWRLELDKRQVIPDNPGEGTPAMVYAPNGKSATYCCAVSVGDCDDVEIPQNVLNWLNDQQDALEAFLYHEPVPPIPMPQHRVYDCD